MNCRFPDEASELDGWLASEQQKYWQLLDEHEEQGKESLPPNQDKIWVEWWVLREVMRKNGSCSVFGASFLAEHTDRMGNESDFRLTLNHETIAVEVTRATGGDFPALKRGRVSQPYLIGEEGRRGAGMITDDAAATSVADDIEKEIGRKCKNDYGKRTVLLIYATSNLSGYARAPLVAQGLKALRPDCKLSQVLVLIDSEPLVSINQDGVCVLD